MASLDFKFTNALVTPFTFVKDLFTEAAHEPQVIPDTASVTVLGAARTGVAERMFVATKSAAKSSFMFAPLVARPVRRCPASALHRRLMG